MVPESHHRLYFDGDLAAGSRVTLTAEESVHAAKSLRLRAGDPVLIVNGRGCTAQAVVARPSPRGLVAEIGEVRDEPRPPGPGRRLVVGVIKGPRFDFLVEKATELGAAAIVPVITRHSDVRPRGTEKPERWLRIAVAAMKQSRRAWLPAVEPVRALGEVLEGVPGSAIRVADPSGAAPASFPPAAAPELHLCVGPEGGWHPDELEDFRGRGAAFISLGDNRLRTETAALALLVLAGALAGKSTSGDPS